MNGRKFRWVYLGENVPQAVSIERIIRGKGQRLEIAGILQETAKSLRQPYIDYIGKLSREKNSLTWWAGSLSEKSPPNSNTFLHACYIKTCADILKKYPDEFFIFFVEKTAVKRAILKNIQVDGLEHVESAGESIHGALKSLKELLFYKVGFLLRNIHRIAISRYRYRMQKRIKSQEPLVLIHTWIDRRSFDENGLYRDVYLGEVPSYLKKNGKNVAIVPYYILNTVSYQKTVNKMAKSKHVFLVPHAFLSITDVFGALFSTLMNMPKKTGFSKFENMDISELIYDDMKNDWIRAYVASNVLFYRFVKRLKEKHLPIYAVIYPYENLSLEKMLCIAMREFYPSAYLIGYQHSTVPTMYLSYFFSKHESNILPLPDRIVTDGRYTRDMFIESGYPEEKVVQGGAVRYAYLLEPKKIARPQKKDKPVILVTPSISRFEAVELIWKVFKAFEQRGEYKILIKCHPDMPFEKISEHLNMKLPEHFTVSDRPIAELLGESDALLYMCSTTSVEAIAAGIPVVHVESDLSIDLDQLDFDPGIRPSARSPEEIVKCVKDAISMSEEELSKKREMWKRVVNELFGTVDESTYRLFLR
jgi:surface carbohydrate biosynthesis protein (TIGR04326 family)